MYTIDIQHMFSSTPSFDTIWHGQLAMKHLLGEFLWACLQARDSPDASYLNSPRTRRMNNVYSLEYRCEGIFRFCPQGFNCLVLKL